MKQKGFTLIELLIVIVIIGIMAGLLVAIINVPEYLRMTRDSRRAGDIVKLQSAITNSIAAQYITLTSTTGCTDCNSISGSTAVTGGGWVKFTGVSGHTLSDFITTLPKDPTNTGTLMYEYFSDGNRFELNCAFESQKYTPLASDDGGNDANAYEKGTSLTLH